jgi:hypothetical protein
MHGLLRCKTTPRPRERSGQLRLSLYRSSPYRAFGGADLFNASRSRARQVLVLAADILGTRALRSGSKLQSFRFRCHCAQAMPISRAMRLLP